MYERRLTELPDGRIRLQIYDYTNRVVEYETIRWTERAANKDMIGWLYGKNRTTKKEVSDASSK